MDFLDASKPKGFGLGLALLIALAVVLLFPGLRDAPIERAEIYFLDAARAMVETGDYLVPRYQGKDFFDKPPLTYWAIASAFQVGGFSPGTARAVSAVAAMVALLATIALGCLLLGRRAALAGGLVFMTTLGVMSFGRLAMSDMLLCALCTLATALAVAALRPNPSRLDLPALGVVLGLGFLAKGPIALLLPGLGIGLLLFVRRQDPVRLSWRLVALAAALCAVTGLGWFAVVFGRLGIEPLVYFFFRENLERFAGEAYDLGRAPWYYVGAYLIQGLPWSLLLPLAAWRAWTHREPAEPGPRFLLGWLGLMAIPLSLSRGKLDYYLLPLFPALSLLIGWWFAHPWGGLDRAWVRLAVFLQAAGLAAAILIRTGIPSAWLPPQEILRALAVGLTVAAVFLLAAAVRPSATRILLAIGGAAAISFVAYAWFLVPAFRNSQPNLWITRDVVRERHHEPRLRLALCSDPLRVQRDILFYAGLATEEHCDIWDPASAKQPFLLLVQPNERAALEEAELRLVGQYRFVPATALTFSGLWRSYDANEVALLANFATDDPLALVRFKRDRKRAIEAQMEKARRRAAKAKAGRLLPDAAQR